MIDTNPAQKEFGSPSIDPNTCNWLPINPFGQGDKCTTALTAKCKAIQAFAIIGPSSSLTVALVILKNWYSNGSGAKFPEVVAIVGHNVAGVPCAVIVHTWRVIQFQLPHVHTSKPIYGAVSLSLYVFHAHATCFVAHSRSSLQCARLPDSSPQLFDRLFNRSDITHSQRP